MPERSFSFSSTDSNPNSEANSNEAGKTTRFSKILLRLVEDQPVQAPQRNLSRISTGGDIVVKDTPLEVPSRKPSLYTR
jgi:hypothetical protein